MTSTNELLTRYRQLFGMFGRSTCEKVTNPSMLLLLALGWYHTAHRDRQKHEESTSKSSKMGVFILISSETRVGWQSRDKEPKNPKRGGHGFLVSYPRAPLTSNEKGFQTSRRRYEKVKNWGPVSTSKTPPKIGTWLVQMIFSTNHVPNFILIFWNFFLLAQDRP